MRIYHNESEHFGNVRHMKFKLARTLLIFSILATTITACGDSSGDNFAGDCTMPGDLYNDGKTIGICLPVDGSLKYVIKGDDVDTIKLLGNLITQTYGDYSYGDKGRSLRNKLGLEWDAGLILNETGLKNFISGNSRWDEINIAIVEYEAVLEDYMDVYKYWCPADKLDEYGMCLPKQMSDSGYAELLKVDEILQQKNEKRNKAIKSLITDLEGLYEISNRDGVVEFYLRTL